MSTSNVVTKADCICYDEDGNAYDVRVLTAVCSKMGPKAYSRDKQERVKLYSKTDKNGRFTTDRPQRIIAPGSYIAAKFESSEAGVHEFWIGLVQSMTNVPPSGKARRFRKAILHDKSIQHVKLGVAWLKPVGPVDAFMNTVAERAAHNESLPGLSVLTAVNVVFRDGNAHVDYDEIDNIIEMMSKRKKKDKCYYL